LRVKLIVILFLAISAVALVGYVSYIGLNNLMTTLEETVQPDYREEQLQRLLYQISEAENSIRIYTITRESQYLNSYYSNVGKADTLIQSLIEGSTHDTYMAHHLDTISQLLNNKTSIQKRLIRLKQDQKRINVYEEVLAKIQSLERKNAVFDSLEIAVSTAEKNLEKEIQEKEKEIVLGETDTEEEKPGFFKRIFGSSKKDEQEEPAQGQIREKKVKELDTLLAAKDTLTNIIDTLKKENITQKIEQSLAEIKVREEKLNKELTIAELILTRRDKNIAYKIQHQVDLVQKYFNQQDVGQAEEASYFFGKITDLIKIIGTISSMLFLVLIFVVMNDIAVNQRYRKQLEVAKNKAEELALAKDEFLSNMSHEIRTPMNAILGFAEQLNNAKLSGQNRQQLNIIQNASKHLLSIINDILDYAKIEAGKIKLEKIPISIEENAQIVYDTLYKNASDKNLDFKLEIGQNIKNHYVKSDPVRFRQILFNLAGNAIKFTDRGFVKIFIDHDFRHIIIKVADSGIGIDQDSIHLIFKKFDQASSNTSRKYGGTGLGLAIVKKLIDMQKGLITVKSEKGEGTEFTVKLPYIPTTRAKRSRKEKSRSTEISLPENVKILLVDDEEYNLLLMESVFNKNNINYKSTRSGKEAIEMFKNEHFDLILIDLQMNDLDGFETTRLLREQHKTHIPIIAATASATREIKNKCINAGMNDILIKPILEGDLLNCLKLFLHPDSALSAKNRKNEKPAAELAEKIDNSDNLKAIFTLFQNDKDLAINMTHIYFKNIVTAVSEFKDNIEPANLESIRNIAHRLIPSTRHMGFEKLADQLKCLEQNVVDKVSEEEIKRQAKQIITDSEEIIVRLEKFLESMEEKINQ